MGVAPRLLAVAGLVSALVLVAAGCTVSSDDTLDFINQTDETVWVAHNPSAPTAFRVRDGRWLEVAPGERVAIGGRGCIGTGELVVATAPDEASVIDRRPIAEANTEICARHDWTWSGIGDHD